VPTVDVPEIDVEDLVERREQGATIIDVREPDEYEDFHVPGARLIPVGEVPERMDEIPRTEQVYVICKSGGRSARVVQFLNEQGYDTVNVAGGSTAWANAGHPIDTGSG
jgi:rhodanese-related sulfurtransferase